jgi:lipopolysaccharide transport system permease protein
MTRRGVRYATDAVTHLVAREFHLRYRRAAFGWLWIVALPLARVLILAFVFTRVIDLGIEDYVPFLFTGLLVWGLFQSGVTSATASVLQRRELLFRPGFPRLAIPAINVGTDAVDFVAALPLLLAVAGLGTGVHLTWLLVPVLLVLLVGFVFGCGLVTAALEVQVQDISQVVSVALLLGFYLTPVFYTRSSLPEGVGRLLDLNPVTHFITAFRDVLLDGDAPAATTTAVLVASCAVALVTGLVVYRRAAPTFADAL